MKKMKRNAARFVSGLLLVLMLVSVFNVKTYAASDYPYGFDFGDTVVSMDAGSTREVWFWSRYNYTYYIGDHTSKDTYVECTFKKGTENIKLHIGKDETVKNVFFYFYIDEDPYKNGDNYASIEVYVQNINQTPAAPSDPAAAALMSYSGNNSAFNAYYYYMNYADLRTSIGANPDALLSHYTTFGVKEGRIANRIK
ncbi:MAG: hypothetical protein II842_06650 [Butyrivibrio sp.]|nr:hypothetical protein [Butyrivibrio sp.]